MSDFDVQCDKEYLYIVLSNIIKNAIKFSDHSEAINISFMDHQCIIQDYWIWIESKNLNNIFNRFFQEQQSRNSDWFGIWLALVSKISNIYNWKITVESIKNQGTKFIINFK
jgi:two-component system, OmpR family, sensor histidine kinase ArlS